MKYLHLSLISALTFTAQVSFAQDASDADLIAKIQKVRDKIAVAAGKSTTCETPRSKNCTFQSSCDQFDGKGMDIYLYQNAEGRQIPNFQLINHMDNLEICVSKPFGAQGMTRDPFLYPFQLVDATAAGGPEQLSKNYQRYIQEVQRTNRIFDEAKKNVLKGLKDRRNSSNAKEIDNMIARVTQVKYWAPTTNADLSQLGFYGCEMPNAAYNPDAHRIQVCPQMMNMPDAALYATIAHELGHSIDPCQSAKYYENSDRGITESTPGYYDEEQVAPKNKVFDAISGAKNPFKQVISCLQQKSSLGSKIPSLTEIIDRRNKDADQALGTREEVAEADGYTGDSATDMLRANHEMQIAGLRKNYDLYKGCYEFSDSGHIGEGFADWIASQAIAEKLKDIPETKKAQEYAFESQSVFMAIDCKNVGQTVVSNLRPLIRNRCEYLRDSMSTVDQAESSTDTHPDTGRRVSRVAYANKEMQKALGCQPDSSVQECK